MIHRPQPNQLKEGTPRNTGTVRYRATGDRMGHFEAHPYHTQECCLLKLKCPLLPVNLYRFRVPKVENDEETEAEDGKRQNSSVLNCTNFFQLPVKTFECLVKKKFFGLPRLT